MSVWGSYLTAVTPGPATEKTRRMSRFMEERGTGMREDLDKKTGWFAWSEFFIWWNSVQEKEKEARKRDRQTERQQDREIERKRERQREKETETETERVRERDRDKSAKSKKLNTIYSSTHINQQCLPSPYTVYTSNRGKLCVIDYMLPWRRASGLNDVNSVADTYPCYSI